jgi:HD-like signal output (HDOD) protein
LDREPSREERIEACLQEIARRPDFPAFSSHIQEVMQALADEDASLRHLTALVLRDFSLTLKVLRTVNSAQYNRSGRAILSVTHAVALLGVDAIRCLAGSLALFEHFQKQSPGLKELMLLSLLTANQARAVAALIRYPRREEAYICGMFRNLGEVLVATYFPRQYASIMLRIKEENLSDREACLRVLHFSYDELGQAMALRWRMPEKVTQVIGAVDRRRGRAWRQDASLLNELTSFCHALTTAVYRRDQEGARARLNLLIQDYLPTLELQGEDVERVLDTAILDTKNTFAILRMPLDGLRLHHQTEAALASAAAEPASPEAAPGLHELASEENLLERLTHEVELLVSSSTDLQLNSVLLMILEAIFRGGPFDRVLFCLVDPGHTTIQGRLGLGEDIDQFRGQFSFPLSVRGGPIGMALMTHQGLFLAGDRPAVQTEVELLKRLGAASFGMHPILVDGILVGCLYFDRLSPAPAPDQRTLALLLRLRDLAATVIKKKRPAPTP